MTGQGHASLKIMAPLFTMVNQATSELKHIPLHSKKLKSYVHFLRHTLHFVMVDNHLSWTLALAEQVKFSVVSVRVCLCVVQSQGHGGQGQRS